MLGVSRQAVSKWELGEGYPEVEKLLILSNKLNISLDSLMTGSVPDSNPQENRRSCMIRVTSPNENVIMDVSNVLLSVDGSSACGFVNLNPVNERIEHGVR